MSNPLRSVNSFMLTPLHLLLLKVNFSECKSKRKRKRKKNKLISEIK